MLSVASSALNNIFLQKYARIAEGGLTSSSQKDLKNNLQDSSKPNELKNSVTESVDLSDEGLEKALKEKDHNASINDIKDSDNKNQNKENELTEEEIAELDDMKARDKEVRIHEQQHQSVGGQYASQPSYTYETGPDGKKYVTDGEVQISMGELDDPDATIAKMEQVRKAALAPSEPSAQDRKVAAEAESKIAELQKRKIEQNVSETDDDKKASEKTDTENKENQDDVSSSKQHLGYINKYRENISYSHDTNELNLVA